MDWRMRSEMNGDVVYFSYLEEQKLENYKQVFIWDMDKTYLDTSIDSLSGLMQAVLEKAFAKRNVPGTRTLLRALSKQFEQNNADFPLFFITASPPQMEERIFEKLSYDGIAPFGSFFKDNLKNLKPGRLARLTKQVGYKLQALLQLRVSLHPEVKQICWGDDSESDAVIYNIYSDICARRISEDDIRKILASFFVTGDQVETILKFQEMIPANDPIEKIYINLATDTDPEYYLKFGRRTFPTYNTFQAALDLFQDKILSIKDVSDVFQDMVFNYGFTVDELMKSFDEMIRRRSLGVSAYEELRSYFLDQYLIREDFKPSMEPMKEKTIKAGRVYELEGELEPWVMENIDYLNDYR